MTSEVTRAEDSPWAVATYAPTTAGAAATPRGDAPGHDLSVATLYRILLEWRWLILSLVALGLAVATLLTLLTTPLYRSQATLEANPPTVEIMDETKGGARGQSPVNWNFISTWRPTRRSSTRASARRRASRWRPPRSPAA